MLHVPGFSDARRREFRRTSIAAPGAIVTTPLVTRQTNLVTY